MALGLDVAYEHFGPGGSLISLGSYVRRIEDVIRPDIALVNGRWVSTPVNGGDALAWGIEVDSKASLTRLIESGPDVDLRFNLTRNWSNVEDIPGSNNRLDQQTRLSSTLAADYRINSQWTAGSGYSFKSGGPVRTSLYRIDGYSTRRELDVYALWSVSQSSKVRLSVSNLLRQDQVTDALYFDSQGDYRVVTGRVSPITVRANLEIRY